MPDADRVEALQPLPVGGSVQVTRARFDERRSWPALSARSLTQEMLGARSAFSLDWSGVLTIRLERVAADCGLLECGVGEM